MSTFEIKGLSELKKTLESLPVKIEKNVLRGGLRAGASVIARAARDDAPVRSGNLRKSIRVGTRAKKGQVIATVRAKSFYAAWVEKGTKPHGITIKSRRAMKFGDRYGIKVDHPGAKAQPFMRRAMETGSAAAVKAMADYIRERIPREIAKAAAL